MTRRGRMGTILSPRHTLPPNTTCTYFFHGIPTDLVWVSFASYHLQILQPSSNDNTTVARVSTNIYSHKKKRKIWVKLHKNVTTNAIQTQINLSGGCIYKSNKWAFF